MAPTTSRFKLPIIVFGIISLLFSACSTPAETDTPASPTEVIQETPTSVPEVPTPLPTREAIPEGLIQVPVPDSAVQTAAELFNAERPPVDRIRLAREYMGVSDEELTPQIPEGTEFQVNDRSEFIFRKNLGHLQHQITSPYLYACAILAKMLTGGQVSMPPSRTTKT